MCKVHINTNRAEVFAENLLTMMNQGALSMMISIGHRTGLFDVLSNLPPSTSEQIANAAGLNERYVREWLGAMTTGKIVVCDPEGPLYSLPEEHTEFLTRQGGKNNIAVLTQYISVLGSVEDEIVSCFRKGGGVPYSSYKRFHEVMAEDSNQSLVLELIDTILPAVEGLTAELEKGINVLDIGCGRGKAITLMAKVFPKSTFTGLDLSPEVIAYAADQVKQMQLRNLEFRTKDLSDFNIEAPFEEYDLITAFDAIHDQARPDNVLAGVYKALKRGGIFLMQDIASSSEHHKNSEHPIGPLLYTISTMHCMTVSLAQNGMGLGAMWGKEKALEMLSISGFGDIQIMNFEHDMQNNYYITRK